MEYILIVVNGNDNPDVTTWYYQEISGGSVVAYKDVDGNVVDLEGRYGEYSAKVINSKPDFPAWGILD